MSIASDVESAPCYFCNKVIETHNVFGIVISGIKYCYHKKCVKDILCNVGYNISDKTKIDLAGRIVVELNRIKDESFFKEEEDRKRIMEQRAHAINILKRDPELL